MRQLLIRRLPVAISTALMVASLWGSGAAASEPVDLLPDLSTMEDALQDNSVVRDPRDGRIYLRFGNAILNSGKGPFHVIGTRARTSARNLPDPNVIPAFQIIHRSDGSTRQVRLSVNLEYHTEHHHYHLPDAVKYELFDGLAQLSATKQSFCLVDIWRVTAESSRHPNWSACYPARTATRVEMGISVGWADFYAQDLVGQSIDVTSLWDQDPHWYTLRSTANPDGLFTEAATSGQSSEIQIWLGRGVPYGVGIVRPGV